MNEFLLCMAGAFIITAPIIGILLAMWSDEKERKNDNK